MQKFKLRWPTLIGLIAFHIGALAAIPFFTWTGLAVAVALYIITGMAICVGYHRLFTHGSFKTFRVVKWFFALVGGLAGESGVIAWVAVHRKHHKHSDEAEDPHSPRHGFLWSHMLWFLPKGKQTESEVQQKFAKDLLKDRVLRFIHNTYVLWHILLGVGLFLAGWLCFDLWTGTSMVLWGVFVRTIFLLHATWAVNSASHRWGYKNYATGDDSRNNWWVALFTFGEGWHNNHHKHPTLANHGHHRWWEMDPAYWLIRVLWVLGLAWDIKDGSPLAKK